MDYDRSDSSGTADDLPPPHRDRVSRGIRVTGNKRSAGAISSSRAHNEMETLIRDLEHEAYISVLRAFKAQSDAITWEKESLITELRKELRLSDDDHRILLGKVNADDIILRIREWRKAGGLQSASLTTSQPVHDGVAGATLPAPRKKQKTSNLVSTQSLFVSSPLHQTHAAPVQPSKSSAKQGAAVGAIGMKPKSGQGLPAKYSTRPMQFPSTGPAGKIQVSNRGSSGAVATNEHLEPARLIGRKVMTRWPADKSFYEAVITDYNPAEGLHSLVYDINTENETWEWVNLKEIPDEDIQWVGDEPGISHRTPHSGPRHGSKKSVGQGNGMIAVGRGGLVPLKQNKRDLYPSQNGVRKAHSNAIEILHTDILLKEMDKVFGAKHPDPLEVEKAKKLLKDHELALFDAIARLADGSDSESGGEPKQERVLDQPPRGFKNAMAGEGRGEGSVRGSHEKGSCTR